MTENSLTLDSCAAQAVNVGAPISAAETPASAAETPASATNAPNSEAALPFAKLYGEPLLEVPRDLYIPPDALAIFLEAFEGPLDLLLYLIRKQNFNVLDIPMAQVTNQYLAYVEQIRSSNLELAGEYLLMAAMLLEIKSRMLLPIKKADSDEEVSDPRAELVRRLLEYEQMKLAAHQLNNLPQLDRDLFRTHVEIARPPHQISWPDVNLDDLRQALKEIAHRARLNQRHRVTHEHLSVREYMTQILRRLQDHRFIEFADLLINNNHPQQSAALIIVNFIALLELTRETLIEMTQVEPFAPLYISLSYQPQDYIESLSA